MSIKRPDDFHAYLVRTAIFDGKWEMPRIEATDAIPSGLVLFSEMKKASSENWVHFYTDDRRFEPLWHNPTAYTSMLQRFEGIISPDFSVYRDMPLPMQVINVYRNHALAYWLSTKGIKVIPNIRWGDERSYEFCFDGFPLNSVVAVGTNGCIKKVIDFEYFRRGLTEMYARLHPHAIVVYGAAPESLFAKYKDLGVQIVQFDSEMRRVHHADKGVA